MAPSTPFVTPPAPLPVTPSSAFLAASAPPLARSSSLPRSKTFTELVAAFLIAVNTLSAISAGVAPFSFLPMSFRWIVGNGEPSFSPFKNAALTLTLPSRMIRFSIMSFGPSSCLPSAAGFSSVLAAGCADFPPPAPPTCFWTFA